jgi:hypothetical protein
MLTIQFRPLQDSLERIGGSYSEFCSTTYHITDLNWNSSATVGTFAPRYPIVMFVVVGVTLSRQAAIRAAHFMSAAFHRRDVPVTGRIYSADGSHIFTLEGNLHFKEYLNPPWDVDQFSGWWRFETTSTDFFNWLQAGRADRHVVSVGHLVSVGNKRSLLRRPWNWKRDGF